MKITLGQISKALDAKLFGEKDKEITRISFDSRDCKDGTLFAALKGEKRDGHDFIPSLAGSGAAVLCSVKPECEIDAVVTNDVGEGLGKIAKWYKENECNLKKTVAITGSVGKTTTKDITACVLSKAYKTHKTSGNFNNALGVPMTVFGVEDDDEVLVCEMGMSAFGEIEALTKIASPDIAMITNIGTSHIEKLGSRENICTAKLEITSGMKTGATLILNGDEPLLEAQKEKYREKYKIITVGLSSKNDIFAVNINCAETTTFDISYKGALYRCELYVPGEHNVMNALFAFAAGVECDIEPSVAAIAVSDFRSAGMRQNVIEKDGVRIMADCYNASRESMCASLKVLCGDKKAKRKIAVLGEMLELGEKSAQFHRDVGECVSCQLPDMLFVLSGAKEIENGAVKCGYPIEKCRYFDDKKALCAALEREIKKGDLVLFKASRGVKLEEIINDLGFEIK